MERLKHFTVVGPDLGDIRLVRDLAPRQLVDGFHHFAHTPVLGGDHWYHRHPQSSLQNLVFDTHPLIRRHIHHIQPDDHLDRQ